ncbi:MAG: hypothetical protein M1814_001989 [Vezdaea aestivalis]|nr:MAG: hypothetical protein M1814_001989 [Vezdaea aestivalis]
MEAQPTFQDVVKAGRQKKQNEAIANRIFSKGRKAGTASAASRRRNGPLTRELSLAGRIGPSKRPSLGGSFNINPSINQSGVYDLHRTNDPQLSRTSGLGGVTKPFKSSRGRARMTALRRSNLPSDDLMMLDSNSSSSSAANGFKFLGAAEPIKGPVYLTAENFASRTTAQDIERVMKPFGGDDLRVTSLMDLPGGVTVNIKCKDRRDANRVVDTFNGEIADGRKIIVFISNTKSQSRSPPTGPAKGEVGLFAQDRGNMRMNWDQRRSRNDEKMAEVSYEDGKYGFGGVGGQGRRNRSRDDRRAYDREDPFRR